MKKSDIKQKLKSVRSKKSVISRMQKQLNAFGAEFIEVVRKYDIVEKIGEGTFGKVYKAINY